MTTIRLYMDEHVPLAVTQAMRRHGVDTLRSQDVGMIRVPDERHLNFAMERQRVMVTQDRDFIELHAAGAAHCGIVFCPQTRSVRAFVRRLKLVCDCITAEELSGAIHYL